MPKSKDCPQDTDFLQYVPTKFQQNRKTMLKKRNRRSSYYQRLERFKNVGILNLCNMWTSIIVDSMKYHVRNPTIKDFISALGMITDFIRNCPIRKFAEY
mgnify:CR=1 FL=1